MGGVVITLSGSAAGSMVDISQWAIWGPEDCSQNLTEIWALMWILLPVTSRTNTD